MIEMFECKLIHLKYPFGEPAEVPSNFDKLTLYVTDKWIKQKSKIQDHLRSLEAKGYKCSFFSIGVQFTK